MLQEADFRNQQHRQPDGKGKTAAKGGQKNLIRIEMGDQRNRPVLRQGHQPVANQDSVGGQRQGQRNFRDNFRWQGLQVEFQNGNRNPSDP